MQHIGFLTSFVITAKSPKGQEIYILQKPPGERHQKYDLQNCSWKTDPFHFIWSLEKFSIVLNSYTKQGTSIYSKFLSTCSTIGKLFVIYLNSFLSTNAKLFSQGKKKSYSRVWILCSCLFTRLLGNISDCLLLMKGKRLKGRKRRWNESYKEIGRTH